jgi:tetratricopeptide (TPR) repeat protein
LDFLSSNILASPNDTNPSTLLNARYQIVPFLEDGRENKLSVLNRWCHDPRPTSIRLFVGPGGTGKTRLFIEWSKRLREEGWRAGFVPDTIDEEQLQSLITPDKPTLSVIDYAECRPGLLSLLKSVAQRPVDETTPLRIVLLAREVADWWQSLQEQDDTVRHMLQQYEPSMVSPIPLEGELQSRVFTHARNFYAAKMNKPIPTNVPDLHDDRFKRILYLHMAALAAVEGLPITADTLIHEIVVHEKHYWIERYKIKYHNDNLETMDFMRRCGRFIAALTLRGGTQTFNEATALKSCVNGPSESHVVSFFRLLYPGRKQVDAARYISGLEPDILGESLVADVLSDVNTSVDYLDHVFENANEKELMNGFVILGRISLYRETEVREWIRQMLDADVAGRALPAFRSAMALGLDSPFSPLGLVLAKSLAREGTIELAAEIERLSPSKTVSLSEAAMWATRCLLDNLDADVNNNAVLAKRARLLSILGSRLSDLGRWEEALAAVQEAVDIIRRLAKDRPDAYLPDLAMILNNLSSSLGDLGRQEEALAAIQEAVDIRRRLAKGRPDVFLPDLAGSLNTLGCRLGDLGRRKEALAVAQEAVDITRRLAKDRPVAFLPDLARSLGMLGSIFRDATLLYESGVAFKEGVSTLQPFFLGPQAAHAGLMSSLVEEYIAVMEKLAKEPEKDLLTPIIEKLKEISEGEIK